MPFRLRNDAKTWFKHISGELGNAPQFDMYYFCLLAGMTDGRLTDTIKDGETAELVDAFPGEYAARGRLLIALLISRELKRQSIKLTERSAVNAAINHLVDPDSPSRLSAEGMRLMNQYSYGGFEVLADWFVEQPRQLSVFLPLLHRRISKSLSAKKG
jgi:hypothetical protein